METTDIFTFYQNDHQSTSFEAFDKMRRKGQFCDLIIKVQNRAITAHKIIVAAGIPYFQSAFDSIYSESEEKEIGVQDNIDPTALESLILFAYTSKLDITVENVQSLLATSQFLQLVQVRDACIEFQSKRLNIENVVKIRELAVSLDCSHLIENCNNFMRQNFDEFSRTRGFLGLSHWRVKELIAEDDLVVSAEEVVFEAIVKWVSFSPSDREASLPELLTEVRMIYLPVPYLIKQVDTQQLITQSKFCRDIVNEVKYYHLLPESRVESVNLKIRSRNCFCFYAICSVDVNSSTRRLSVFTLVNNKWLALPPSRNLQGLVHRVINVDDKIYIFINKSEVLVFKLGSHEWEWLKSFQHCIDGAAVVCHEKTIYCFGSYYTDFLRAVRGFDTQLNVCCQTKQMQMARVFAAAASQGKFIYVTGGMSDTPKDNIFSSKTTVTEKYSPSNDKWTSVSSMLVARFNHGCTSLGGKIYVCGGDTKFHEGTLNVAEMYDPVVNRWSYISPMQRGGKVISLFTHCSRIYTFGETNAEVYEVETDEWKPCPFVPMKLRGAMAISPSRIKNDQRPVVPS